MNSGPARYQLDRARLELALQMIALQARTHTIKDCTGLSDDRIRKLYATYFKTRDGATVRRQRGKSPQRVDVLFRSSAVRLQVSALAALLAYYGLLDARAGVPKDIAYGQLFCRAYLLFCSLCPDSQICFERAWMLCEALLCGDELVLEVCARCTSRYVHDQLALAPRLCPGCRAD